MHRSRILPSQIVRSYHVNRSTIPRAMAIARETSLSDIPTPEAIKPLFEGLDAGSFCLETRVVYAPLTRCRAIGNIPADISIEYYKNRAEKGQLVITEATVVDETGHGYPNTPGIYTAAQKEAWKPIVQAVHDKGGIFFCQIWHVGRISTEAYQPGGNLPVAPSAIAPPNTKSMNPSTFQMEEIPTPRALQTSEISKLIQSFREGARAAVKEVGFDGVEIHGASGYIIQQFLSTSSNQRTDEYGGSIENRCRFCLEVLDAVVDELGADKVGIRLSPYGNFNDTTDDNTKDLYNYLCGEIQKRGIAYLHMVESRVIGADDVNSDDAETLDSFREAAKPLPFIAAGGYTRESAAEAIASGHCDMVAMGRWAIANPDLLKRFKLDAPLNKYNRATFYTPGPEGLIDYPLLQDTEEGAKFFSD